MTEPVTRISSFAGYPQHSMIWNRRIRSMGTPGELVAFQDFKVSRVTFKFKVNQVQCINCQPRLGSRLFQTAKATGVARAEGQE
jgi:hypothetical protein